LRDDLGGFALIHNESRAVASQPTPFSVQNRQEWATICQIDAFSITVDADHFPL
jgi:hypothetical protein